MGIKDDMDEAIARHFIVPPEVRRQAAYATQGLYFGPYEAGHVDEGDEGAPYLGFTSSCELVQGWCNDNLSEVWYDTQSGEVLESEPEGYYDEGDVDEETGDARWVEPYWEDYFHAELRDVKRALFDKELVQHI